MGLQQNIKARKLATELFTFLEDETSGLKDEAVVNRFWACVAEMATAKLPAKPPKKPGPTDPMDREEQLEFESERMPFGEHKGKRIGYVPLSYLLWLQAASKGFQRKLDRYLASDAVQAMQEETDR